ncbi:MAG: hypothetical protein DMG57_35460 [Acidobacteria bacterium]|nr:MAG: hypothetical protein DMG57_35460 [Acidobacteriota bacterium]
MGGTGAFAGLLNRDSCAFLPVLFYPRSNGSGHASVKKAPRPPSITSAGIRRAVHASRAANISILQIKANPGSGQYWQEECVLHESAVRRIAYHR